MVFPEVSSGGRAHEVAGAAEAIDQAAAATGSTGSSSANVAP